ncbi:hypothetical protein M406DRAFT_294452 [Cryphonectria parasitica EP155]|uniref:Dienelactone hydrolase n=1 Tax=Cryphonectria parasitica (strain ATCC 38755 / EP155) TaxID=660469 RepID=A0A9P4XXQ8_CRYP1|nr:uncharacterized protein M406DRAFT_294452 [Cryphonectria parasitica EP155]KAF3762717.1 hypothetical protein M406DRAFT_294452 [Cryphonectria parasitica EP155]
MEVNVPGFNVNAVLPERTKGKNVAVVSQHTTNHNDPGFLSDDFPRNPPKLYVTAESDDFDNLTLAEWRDEGFQVEYVPMGDGGDDYVRKLERLAKKNLGPCETFGIVAYGDAASFCLEHYHILDNNEGMKLGLLIAYYPTRIPEPQGKFPSSIQVLVHLVGNEVGVVKHSQMVGIQGKRRVVKRNVDPGIGAGRINKLAYPSYTYSAEAGFAEHDLDEYERISAELAWSRSLTAARKAFHRYINMELTLDENIQSKFFTRNTQNVMSSYTTHKTPHVTYLPTLTGGVGAAELERFYSDYFLSANPPSTRLRLISRTIGADRLVDEVHMSFKHTQEMPWILPGVPPTGKRVEVLVVSIVTVRGGKLYSEHVYWDQASVLVQTGLLDPKLVPDKAKTKWGVEELPVVGRDAARRVLRGMEDVEDGEADNELIPGWYEDEDEESGDDNDDDDDQPVAEKKSQSSEVEKPAPDKKETEGEQA